jgi:hypothetical protein
LRIPRPWPPRALAHAPTSIHMHESFEAYTQHVSTDYNNSAFIAHNHALPNTKRCMHHSCVDAYTYICTYGHTHIHTHAHPHVQHTSHTSITSSPRWEPKSLRLLEAGPCPSSQSRKSVLGSSEYAPKTSMSEEDMRPPSSSNTISDKPRPAARLR